MSVKKFVGYIHLYLGLAVGVVAVVSYLPAALFVWEAELTDWYYRQAVFTDSSGSAPLPLPVLLDRAQQALPVGQPLTSVSIPRDARRSYAFVAYKRSDKPATTFFEETLYWKTVYVDPYTGAVRGTVDHRFDWITLMRYLHRQLLLDYPTGHQLVGWVTLIMFVLVATGLVLWWPRTKAARKQRFRIKLNAKWKRLNHDIHNVGGFYTHVIILFLAATGLVWTFEWWTNGIYRLLGNDPKAVYQDPPPLTLAPEDIPIPFDTIWQDLALKRGNWTRISLFWGSPKGAVSGTVRYSASSGWDVSDRYLYHPQYGTLHFAMTHDQKTLGAKWRGSNYAIHVGNIYGLPTKIIASLVSLFCASLPVTGFIIWYNRKWGKKKKRS